ncbi:MAG: hypothetical protein JO104_06735, partial [Candidatus Eremiobacteraeota bacterium]|nr:hypothetical protein [Candidatus Eremiobacteraeota bacterium]
MTRLVAAAAAVLFAAFVAAKGVPTLRHDWNWPIARDAIGWFLHESTEGWLSPGFGTPNPHPTTYLIGAPLAAIMWLIGPPAALALLAGITGYLCMRGAALASERWNGGAPAALGIGLFALFNPWVYNEVVAGHLVMVLAYGGIIGMLAEMLRGRAASPVRLALWIALIEAQLQFFILAIVALSVFAFVTKKWLPPLAGVLFALPSVIGLFAERGTLLQTPYALEWQANQSVAPLLLLGLGGYFAGYADRLGMAATVAVWIVLALTFAGTFTARRTRTALWMFAAAVVLYAIVAGVRGPFAVPYAWMVRHLPESGVFRELYDLAGAVAALVVVLAAAAAMRVKQLGYVALAAGITLPVTWLLHPPSDLWVAATAYPHAIVSTPPFARVALVPAFQPLGLRDGSGAGADPDAQLYSGSATALNEYFPTYPVDAALARFEQSGDTRTLRALGVAKVVDRPWLVSPTRGALGLAAISLQPHEKRVASMSVVSLAGAEPLVSGCSGPRIVAVVNAIGPCDVFFADATRSASFREAAADNESINSQTSWIDARLAFAEAPALAQAFGGALTQSTLPYRVQPASWLLAYVRGRLVASDGRTLMRSKGGFAWSYVPAGVTSVTCVGLCEIVAQARSRPDVVAQGAPATEALL